MDRPDNPAPPGASPVKAFLIILALIILTTVIFLMAANGEGSPNAIPTESNPPPDFSLTDEEAIARFEELHELWLRAIQERDPSLLQLVFFSNSPSGRRAQAEIRRLQRDDVTDESDVTVTQSQITDSTDDAIHLVATLLIRPCFRDADGRDVTEGDALISQEGEWTLMLESGTWLLDDASLISDEVIEAGHASCEI